MSAWQQQLQQLLKPEWRKRLLGDVRSELSSKCTDTLVLLGSSLVHLQSNQRLDLSPSAKNYPAQQLAQSAAQLVKQFHSDEKDRSILLLLPPSEFVATTSSMPGLSGANLYSALKLQQESLLPAFDDDLVLTVQTDATQQQESVTALWLPQLRLDELFAAFHEEELMLAVVKPRLLQLHGEGEASACIEEDGDIITAISVQNGSLQSWLQLNKQDLLQAEFAEQWQAETANLPAALELNTNDNDSYIAKLHAEPQFSYSLFPTGALAERKKAEKGRQALYLALAFAGLLLLASLPFVAQSFELSMANSRLASTQEMSTDARADQSIVVDFENQWGIFNDYPDQQVRLALFQLQEVLGAERLSSLELTDGLIRIQGTSSDPQAILQRLEQDPMFTEVVFSRATNNTRYYIDLRLASVNFEGYIVRYFPD